MIPGREVLPSVDRRLDAKEEEITTEMFDKAFKNSEFFKALWPTFKGSDSYKELFGSKKLIPADLTAIEEMDGGFLRYCMRQAEQAGKTTLPDFLTKKEESEEERPLDSEKINFLQDRLSSVSKLKELIRTWRDYRPKNETV